MQSSRVLLYSPQNACKLEMSDLVLLKDPQANCVGAQKGHHQTHRRLLEPLCRFQGEAEEAVTKPEVIPPWLPGNPNPTVLKLKDDFADKKKGMQVGR